VRGAVVILIGSLSQHLEMGDPKIPSIVNKLIDTLKVPSEHVQLAVAECLPPLVKLIKDGKQLWIFSLCYLFFYPFHFNRLA